MKKFVEYKLGNTVAYYKIGIPTGLISKEGRELHTGDEVIYEVGKFAWGKLGFIAERNQSGLYSSHINDKYFWWMTNKEMSMINPNAEQDFEEMSKVFYSFDLPFIKSKWLSIKTPFSELKVGDEIAIGRKTGVGFKIVNKEDAKCYMEK